MRVGILSVHYMFRYFFYSEKYERVFTESYTRSISSSRLQITASGLTERVGAGSALAVLNVPLFLIVQPRKRRKPSTTLVWNGRNCFCHGSAGIQ